MPQREQMFFTVVTFQRLSDRRLVTLDAPVFQRRQFQTVTFPARIARMMVIPVNPVRSLIT